MHQDIIWLCDCMMRFQSKTHFLPLLTIESPVAQWLEHPTISQKVMGLNPIWNSDFFPSLCLYMKISFKSNRHYHHYHSYSMSTYRSVVADAQDSIFQRCPAFQLLCVVTPVQATRR